MGRGCNGKGRNGKGVQWEGALWKGTSWRTGSKSAALIQDSTFLASCIIESGAYTRTALI